jgi:glutamine synthetase
MSDQIQAAARFEAVRVANSRQPRRFERVLGRDGKPEQVAAYFGANTFSLGMMEEKLPRPIFERIKACIQDGQRLDLDVAHAVAHSVKEWALGLGVSHFTHWFQPMTGQTAEKHDAFLTLGKNGEAIERFTAAMLVQSEPDASSFPSGGTRSTFEARGYTAWDPSSPMFIMETENGKTLCIPSAFISYTGAALDKKVPLLRSMEALDNAARRLLTAIGEEPRRVVATLGCEQEYFLVDRAYWSLRPDLAIGGRTVVGAPPPKGQSLEDHYFGSIPPRVQAFMQEVEQELYKLGVPAKTRHNEVAPCQFELAPIFREANVSIDHNQLIMEVLQRVAQRHDYKVLLHEKPYAGINGSGKHCNWSMSDSTGENLLEPGKNPHDSLRFLAVLAAVLLGVWRYNGVLRAFIGSWSNDFRLGANEAPPAIMSIFVGELLNRICDDLAEGKGSGGSAEQAMMSLGVSQLPQVAKDNTDRNRTSPIAFTGNKFEVRAVGSRQNPSQPMTAMNTIVAEGMDQITAWIQEAGGGPEAALAAIRKAIIESKNVRFEGNGYSAEWVEEAARRGLKNHVTTPAALTELGAESTLALFEKHKVYAREELEARGRILAEQYITNARIEVDLMRTVIDTMIMPAALGEAGELAGALDDLLDVADRLGMTGFSPATARLGKLTEGIRGLHEARAALEQAVDLADADVHHAAGTSTHISPALQRCREAADYLETLVSDGRWPLPKYRELLFLS